MTATNECTCPAWAKPYVTTKGHVLWCAATDAAVCATPLYGNSRNRLHCTRPAGHSGDHSVVARCGGPDSPMHDRTIEWNDTHDIWGLTK